MMQYKLDLEFRIWFRTLVVGADDMMQRDKQAKHYWSNLVARIDIIQLLNVLL